MTTLAHISDLHFGRIDLVAAEALVSELARLKPDLVIVSGDLTQRARRSQFAAAKSFLTRLPSPQLVVPGNHDVPLYDLVLRWRQPYQRFAQYICDDPFPSWQNCDTIVVGINTACRFAPRLAGFWKDGKIRPQHLEELRRRFAPEPAFPASEATRILVAHHPFIEPESGRRHGIIHGASEALPLLEQLKIDLILGGHLHRSFQNDIRAQHSQVTRPIINLLAGSTTSTRRREAFHAYNVIRIDQGKLAIEVRRFRNNAWSSGDSI